MGVYQVLTMTLVIIFHKHMRLLKMYPEASGRDPGIAVVSTVRVRVVRVQPRWHC